MARSVLLQYRNRALLAGLLGVLGCGLDDPASRTVVSDSAGITVLTLRDLPSLNDPAYAWRLVRTRSIPTESGRMDEPPLLYRPEKMTRLEDGTLVVGDLGEWRVVVIDAETDSVVRRFGRVGSGPGEVRDASPWPGANGTVWAADAGNTRTTRFTLEGEVVSSTRWQLVGGGGVARVAPAGGRLVAHRYWVVRTGAGDRAIVDSLAYVDLETGDLQNFVGLPRGTEDRIAEGPAYGRRIVWTVLPNGGAVVGRTHTPAYRYFSSEGELLREIRLRLSIREISEADRREIRDELSSLAGIGMPQEIGSHFPITTMLYAVDDSIFAMYQGRRVRAAEDPPIPADHAVWRLITVSGRYAGAIHFPERFGPRWIGDGYVLGVTRDSLDVATIEEFALEPPDALQY